MPKLRYREIKENINDEKLTALRFYESKYFGLFLNAYKFTNLSKNQSRYLLKKMWKNGTVACFILEGSKKEPTLKEALTNAPYLFIIAIVSLLAYITITILGKKKLKKVLESDEFNSFNNNSETLLARLLNDLRIPHDSKQVDVLLYAYSLDKKNKEKNMTALQMSKYINMELYLFKENDSVCLANLDEVVSIPLRDIKEIVKVNKKIDMMQWNKDEAYNKGRYKEYKITMNQYNIYFFKPYYSIRINDGNEEFEIIVPPYDIEFFNEILNLEIKESNE